MKAWTLPEEIALMKYRELRDRLAAMPEDELDYTVTAYLRAPEGGSRPVRPGVLRDAAVR